MRKAGVDQTVIMKLTGHKTFSMFNRYNTVDQDDAIMAMQKLNRLLSGQKTRQVQTMFRRAQLPKKIGTVRGPYLIEIIGAGGRN